MLRSCSQIIELSRKLSDPILQNAKLINEGSKRTFLSCVRLSFLSVASKPTRIQVLVDSSDWPSWNVQLLFVFTSFRKRFFSIKYFCIQHLIHNTLSEFQTWYILCETPCDIFYVNLCSTVVAGRTITLLSMFLIKTRICHLQFFLDLSMFVDGYEQKSLLFEFYSSLDLGVLFVLKFQISTSNLYNSKNLSNNSLLNNNIGIMNFFQKITRGSSYLCFTK